MNEPSASTSSTMTTDTPRTDAKAQFFGWNPDEGEEFVTASFCRELERENAALRADKERLDWIETNARLTRKAGYLRWSFEGPECGTVRGSIDIARGKEAQP